MTNSVTQDSLSPDNNLQDESLRGMRQLEASDGPVAPIDSDPVASQQPSDDATMPIPGTPRANILIVDDEKPILRFLNTILLQEGYEVQTFESAESALDAITAAPGFFDIVLTDIAMPGMSGVEMLQLVSKADRLIVKIVMTGYATVDIVVNCLREGAIDLMQKPIASRVFLAAIDRAMERRMLIMGHAKRHILLEQMVEQRSEQLRRTLADVKQSYEFTLEALTVILDAREHQTGRHSLRVREMAIWLARWMQVGGSEIDEIATGALLHDIGKIAVPDRILLSTDALSPDDWRIMREHSAFGSRILVGSPRLAGAATIVQEHHERFDGQGYPKGLRGEEISLGARIFALVDTYDAMRSNRVYSEAVSESKTVEEIVKHSGEQFDPAVVKAFLEHRQAFDEQYRRLCDDLALPSTTLTT